MTSDQLLDGLDDAQRAAVTDPHRPLAILAPAGSGKTRVLTRRVAWLAQADEIDPRRALCLSFTRDAARELRSRLARSGLRDLPAAGTFHATASAVLRLWHADRGRRPPTLVEDRRAQVARSLGRGAAGLDALVQEIAWAKAQDVRPEDYGWRARQARRSPPGGAESTARHFASYEESLARAGLVDFDDLLRLCADALEQDDRFAAAQRWRFRHLFVDEFQDVNPVQFRLLAAFLGGSGDVTVVGDPDQAIYGWNGADARYLLDVEDHLPGARVLRLGTNYRSVGPVVAAATSLVGTAVHAARGEGPVPEVVSYVDEAEELRQLARWARHDEGISWSDQAVLVRTNTLGRRLVVGLNDAGVPAAMDSGRSGLVPPEVREVAAGAAAFADLLDPGDDVAPAVAAACRELALEYLALDPAATPTRFAAWLIASAGPGSAPPSGRGGRVCVATFHAAKGLEWRAVQVAGLEEGFVPVARTSGLAQLAEEQRLLHVALSRATDRLSCSWTARRPPARAARHVEAVDRRPSRFLPAVLAACEEARAAAAPTPPGEALHRARRGLARPADPPGPRLAALFAWRAAQARGARINPAAVLPDDALAALAEHPPRTVAELASVPGVGPLRARRLGDGLLAALEVDPADDAATARPVGTAHPVGTARPAGTAHPVGTVHPLGTVHPADLDP